jgi:hypothetical protein
MKIILEFRERESEVNVMETQLGEVNDIIYALNIGED